MIRRRLFALFGAILLFFLMMLGSSSQKSDNQPLSCSAVLELWNSEKAQIIPKNRTSVEIGRDGVDFDLAHDCEQCELKLRGAGMSGDLISLIRTKVRTSTAAITCVPAECKVQVNGRASGVTSGSHLTVCRVAPGPVTVEVNAPPYQHQSQTKEAAVGQLVDFNFPLELPRGGLDITCEPQDCSVHVRGPAEFERRGTTTKHALTLRDLASGEYSIDAEAENFKTSTVKTFVLAPDIKPIRFDLVRDECAAMTPLQIYDGVLSSLGGTAIEQPALKSRSTGKVTISGETPWKADLLESREMERVRWDLTRSKTKWSVIFDGQKSSADGDKVYRGTQAVQDLEDGIRALSRVRLPAVLSAAMAKLDIKKDCSKSQFYMLAEPAEDQFIFNLDNNYTLVTLHHDHLASPSYREEVEFSNYKSVGEGLKMPYVIIIKDPDRAGHRLTFEFDRIELGVTFKDSQKLFRHFK